MEHFLRGNLLYQQNRYDDAVAEFRKAVTADPQDPDPHAMLALVFLEQSKYDDAEREAAEAVRCGPDQPYPHYARGSVLLARRRYAEAEAAAAESLRLDPTNAGVYALLAISRLNRRDAQGAREAAEAGLAYDPHQIGCSTARTQALTLLGERGAALEEAADALRRNPDNDLAHAGRGWALLHAGQPGEALVSFREALRLDPTNAWAREGMLEALKARYWLYRQMLRWFLWMARLPMRVQIGLLVAVFLLPRALGSLADADSALRIPALVAIGLLALFAVMTWVAQPLFNLILMTSRHGRLILERGEKRQALLVGLLLLLAVGSAVLHFTVEPLLDHLFGALGFLWIFLLLPLTLSFRVQGGRRYALLGIAAAMMATNIVAAVHFLEANAAYQRLLTMNPVPPQDPKQRLGYGANVQLDTSRAVGGMKEGYATLRLNNYLMLLTVVVANAFAFLPQRR